MPEPLPAPSSTRAATDAEALKATEAALDRFARRIDFALRRRYCRRGLLRLLRTARTGQPPPAWLPSPWTLLFAVALLLALPRGDAGSLLGGWPWVLTALAACAFEVAVLPWLLLGSCRFHLMRLEHAEPRAVDTYLVAPVREGGTGFGLQAWAQVRGVEVGDIVMSIGDAHERGLAIMPLRTEGRLPLASCVSDAWHEQALPPLTDALKTLASDFDAACDRHQAASAHIERGHALRSARYAPRERDPEAAWNAVALAPDTKTRLRALAEAFAAGQSTASCGLLLYGPPGTGKTLIARALAESVDCAFYPLSLPDLKSGYIGQSGANVKALWQNALAQQRAVIFVDECDAVFGRRGSVTTDAFAEEIVASFIAAWDGFSAQASVWVIGASNRRELIDPAVLSRFEDEVEIGLPDAPRRREILQQHLARYGSVRELPSRSDDLTAGLSGRDLAAIAKRLVRVADASADANPADPVRIHDAELAAVAQALRHRGAATPAPADWDALIVADDTLRELQTTAALMRSTESLQQRGIDAPRGMLLYGPPGTGKTLAARVLAHASGLRFIAASTADIKQGFVGQSGQKLHELFERAREAAPALLFIDEIDSVAGRRDGHQDAFVAEIVGQLLQDMDGVRQHPQPVFVLAASNHPERIDEAVLSRLSRRIEMPLPDAGAIARILCTQLAGKPLAFDIEAGVQALAARAAGASGRDLRDWVEHAAQRAAMRALQAGDADAVQITLSDFG